MQEPKKISGVLGFSIRQSLMWLTKELADLTGHTMTYALVGNTSSLREAEQQMEDRATKQNIEGKYYLGKTDNLSYPFALYSIAEIALDGTRGTGLRKNHAFEGYVTKKYREAGIALVENLRPVTVGLAMNFRTDSMDTVISLAHVLLMAAPKVQFSMMINDDFEVQTSMAIDPTITIPQTNMDSPGESFQYEAVLTLNTYIGYSETKHLIKKIAFNRLIDTEKEPFFAGTPEEDLKYSYTYVDLYDRDSRMFRGDLL
jgi:hypothetical protein